MSGSFAAEDVGITGEEDDIISKLCFEMISGDMAEMNDTTRFDESMRGFVGDMHTLTSDLHHQLKCLKDQETLLTGSTPCASLSMSQTSKHIRVAAQRTEQQKRELEQMIRSCKCYSVQIE